MIEDSQAAELRELIEGLQERVQALESRDQPVSSEALYSYLQVRLEKVEGALEVLTEVLSVLLPGFRKTYDEICKKRENRELEEPAGAIQQLEELLGPDELS